MSDTQVHMTVEPSQSGYGQHRLRVERGDAASAQSVTLTDGELAQLEHMIGAYRAAKRVTPSVDLVIGATFADPTGRGEAPGSVTGAAACQCSAHPHPCTDPPTGKDRLCDHCGAGCLLVGDGSFFVHFSHAIADPEPRMARLREHCTGEVTMYAPAFWAEPAAQ